MEGKKTRKGETMVVGLLYAPIKGMINGSIDGSIKLMKQLFLISKRIETELIFRPYDLGPVCFEVYEIIDKLKEEGIVIEVRKGSVSSYSISKDKIEEAKIRFESLSQDDRTVISEIKENHNDMDSDDLILAIYKEFPAMTERSIFIPKKKSFKNDTNNCN